MTNTPPPIQEAVSDNVGVFKRVWIRWLQDINDRLSALEGNSLSSLTSFGESVSAKNKLIVSGSAIYGFLPTNFRDFTDGSGTAGVENRLFKVTTGTSVGGYGAIHSFRSIPAKAGIGNMARFSGYFESSAANSWQGIGLISISDELSFGYDGTDFGIWHRYGGLPEVRTITVTGAAGGSENLTLTLNSVAYTIPLTTGTVEHNAYEIAAWLNSNQTVWAADQLDDTVIINALSDGAKSGTYSFSSSSATGTIAQNTAGVTKTSTHIPQSTWNQNRKTDLDPSKGNVYQILYQNMGYGEVNFYIEDQKTAGFILVHTLKIANTQTTTLLSNPSMRVGMYCVSLGSTTDLAVYAESFGGYIQGEPQKTRNPRSFSSTQTLSTTNFTNIITLRNRRTYNDYINQVEILPLKVTIANEINKNVIVEVRATTDTGVEQDFTTADTNLVGDVDTSAVTITAGSLFTSFTIEPAGRATIDLQELGIQMPPTLNLVIQAQRQGGASGDVSATITWYEDV